MGHYDENNEIADGWFRDGHKVRPVLLQDYVKLEVICPFPEDGEQCDLEEAIEDVGAECIDGIGGNKIRDFPLEVDYRWSHMQHDDAELWLRPSYDIQT